MKSQSFGSMYNRMFKVIDGLLNGEMEINRAMAFAANMKVMNDMINTEVRINQIELTRGTELPALGGRVIQTADYLTIESQPDNRLEDKTEVKEEEVFAVRDVSKEIAELSPSAPSVTKVRNPKVGIVGLNPMQAGKLQQQFADQLDMSAWLDDGEHRLREIAKSDVVFMNVGRISHKTQEILESENANVVKVANSPTLFSRVIKQYFTTGAGAK